MPSVAKLGGGGGSQCEAHELLGIVNECKWLCFNLQAELIEPRD